jgi:hypothetical protein
MWGGCYVDGPYLLRHQNICHEMLSSQKVLSRVGLRAAKMTRSSLDD